MSAAIIAKQVLRVPLAAAARPALTRLQYSTSTSITETREPVALQAEIVSGAPGE